MNVDLRVLLNSNKIIPHYERVKSKIVVGGGGGINPFTSCISRISLVCKL